MPAKLSSLLLCLVLATSEPIAAADIYLVRHAEKVTDASRDPELTENGLQRAANLAVILSSAGIERIFSTDFRRTRDTAAPLAELLGVEIEIYDPDELEELAQQLLALESAALVVGHSNTTPELVELLGGEGGPPIDEATEYDRLYLVQTRNGMIERMILLHIPPASHSVAISKVTRPLERQNLP
jgi:phosphohistidine phosphatase SixA